MKFLINSVRHKEFDLRNRDRCRGNPYFSEVKIISMKYLLIFCLLLICTLGQAQEIVPLPNSYKQSSGVFKIPQTMTISGADLLLPGMISTFSESLSKFTSFKIKDTRKNATIRIVRNPEISGKEAYRMKIDSRQITIEAGFPNGFFYGLQSLVQLLHSGNQSSQIECAEISDQPRYEWRGLMLDESRHFFGQAEVMKILDMMALHKLNKFHWHLTDSPGWRIEIRQYPLLTSIGSKGNNSDPNAQAKFYTQKQIAEIVQYAAARFIEVIPEIDMPGHATSAVKAYPEFSGGGSEKYPDFTFNPGKEGTYQFLTTILREVAGLFPSEYIHIGGDEVSFGNQQWQDLPEIRILMHREKLANLLDVEHYFLKRMADSVQSLGKTIIGWDEVVTAGLSNKTCVMWWRHDKPQMLDLAIKKGFEVILCPRIPFYFDFVQHTSHKDGRKWAGKFAPIESVYNFPTDEFTGGVSISTPLIKGVQANLWSETIHTDQRLEFMTFPRLSALAESAWTNQEVKNLPDFLIRMKNMEAIYQKSGVLYYDFRKEDGGKEINGPGKPKNMIE